MEPMLSPLALNPFTLINDFLGNVGLVHEKEYDGFDAREDFWDQECSLHPTMAHCKVYED